MVDLSPPILRTMAAILTTVVVAVMVPYCRSIALDREATPRDWDIGIDLSVTAFCFCFGSLLQMGADVLSWWNSGGVFQFNFELKKAISYLALAFLAVMTMLFLIKLHKIKYKNQNSGSYSTSFKNNLVGGLALINGIAIH